MSGVEQIAVEAEDSGLRLDRWFRQHYPQLGHGRLEKLLRTGQIRVNGKRAKASLRIEPGQQIRVPPMAAGKADVSKAPKPAKPPVVDAGLLADIRQAIVWKDDAVLVVNKPAGLAVQGGSRTVRHLDGLLDGLKFERRERPRLVHRLDKDTSGALVLARSRQAATKLASAFRRRDARKVYWALVAGEPSPARGLIDFPLSKIGTSGQERMRGDAASGKAARTYYAVVDKASRQAAWLALMPVTGRTHQLRAHCAEIGTPVLGDGKYGGVKAHLAALDLADGMHLHAHALDIAHPEGGRLNVSCPPPASFVAAMRALGFDPADYEDPFLELEG